VTQFISNSTDVLASSLPYFGNPDTAILPWHAQLVPTLLYQNQTALKGELWRSLIVIDRVSEEQDVVWDDFCITDVDQVTYAEIPLNMVVFWSDSEGRVDKAELPAFRVTLKRTTGPMPGTTAGEGSDADFVVQT
jgi:hypothetical protein